MASRFDLVVIGSGTGGYVAAIRAAQLGLSTAVVERQPVLGGTCLNWGCIPTKALLEHAHALKIVQQAEEWGVRLASAIPAAIDMDVVHARKDRIVASLNKGVEYLFRKHRIEWIKGTGRLAGGGDVDVVGDAPRTLHAREIIVATGSAARSVPGIAIDRRQIITSDQAIALARVPESIGILGAGAVGVEFASIFHRFGSRVVLIEALPAIVPGEDAAVSAELLKQFRKRGIDVRTASTVVSAESGDAGVSIDIRNAQGAVETLTVETLLVATGRGPVTDGLGASAVGLALDERGYVRVDDLYRTNVPAVSAIGDVISLGDRPHPQLAHVSSAEGILVAERLAGHDVKPLEYDHMPSATYCEPEIGSVGLTEAAARARGFDVRVGTFPFSVLGRARMAGDTEGFVKIVGETRYDQLLGVHIIGGRATELVAEGAAALRLESTVEDLARTIHAHPTMSEAIGEAAHAALGAAIHL
jgi:dihydrolipoamide dehydrogenase